MARKAKLTHNAAGAIRKGKRPTRQSGLKSITQASALGLLATVGVVILLITKYHIALVPHVKQRASRNSIAPELLSHPINNPGGQGQPESNQNSENSEQNGGGEESAPDGKKPKEFKTMFDRRLSAWKPAIPPPKPPPKVPSSRAASSSSNSNNPSSNNAAAPPSNSASSPAAAAPAAPIVFRPPVKAEAPDVKDIDYDREPESMDFVFHNKLPKSGSSTMNSLLRQLAKENSFNFEKLEPADIPGDKFDLEDPIVRYIKENLRPPFLVLKHHYFFNFSRYDLPGGIRDATYINVLRNPIDWFVSHYYFERFGWQRKADARGFKGSDADRDRTVDECVRIRHPECVHPGWKYIEFICGTSPLCQTARLSTVGMQRAVLIAKRNVATRFYMVGILEQFEQTLKLFEKMMPKYYAGAYDLYHSSEIQGTVNQTKTVGRKEVSDATREFFSKGPLRFALDLYNYSLMVFNHRLKKFDIEPSITIVSSTTGSTTTTADPNKALAQKWEEMLAAKNAPGGQTGDSSGVDVNAAPVVNAVSVANPVPVVNSELAPPGGVQLAEALIPVPQQPLVQQAVVAQPFMAQPAPVQVIPQQPLVQQVPVQQVPVQKVPVQQVQIQQSEPAPQQMVAQQVPVAQQYPAQSAPQQSLVLQPLVQQPVVQQPLAQQPLVQQPIMQQQLAPAQPIQQQLIPQQPVVYQQQPVVPAQL